MVVRSQHKSNIIYNVTEKPKNLEEAFTLNYSRKTKDKTTFDGEDNNLL